MKSNGFRSEKLQTILLFRLDEMLLFYVPEISSFSLSLPSLQTGIESNNNFFLI